MKLATLIFGACILAVAVGALAIRLPQLDSRPMHPDEANQAFKAGELFDAGEYQYDPKGHHGPSLYYLTLPALNAGGAHDFADSEAADYRIVPVIFGAAIVLLLLAVGRDIGWPAAIVAAVLTAISSPMVYYSRYYVQETLLVFFTFGTIISVWRMARGGSVVWAIIAGIFFGLMYATKETWALSAAAAAGGIVFWAAWTRLMDGRWPLHLPRTRLWQPAIGVLVAVAVIVVFYSSFGKNWAGPVDSVVAYGHYLGQATNNSAHIHPWHYYLSLLVYQHPQPGFTWSEGLIVGLAVIGVVAALAGKGLGQAHVGLVRFLAFYTILLTVIYSVIPYKTPWCVLTFLQVMTVMAGVGAVALVRFMRLAPLQAVAAAGLLLSSVALIVLPWLLAAKIYGASGGIIFGIIAAGVLVVLTRRSQGQFLPVFVWFLFLSTTQLSLIYLYLFCVLKETPATTPGIPLCFLQVMAMIGAASFAWVIKKAPVGIIIGVILTVLAGNLAYQMYWLNFRLPADQRNPWVYAHTSPDVLKLVNLVDRLAAASPKGRDLDIQVFDTGYWPLPWYLRQYPKVGYREEVPHEPQGFQADVVIVSTDLEKDLNSALRGTYNKQALFGLRHGFNVRVYADEGLWQAMLARSVSGSGGTSP
jgi:uncharacterized protein (TIGR03663 family)